MKKAFNDLIEKWKLRKIIVSSKNVKLSECLKSSNQRAVISKFRGNINASMESLNLISSHLSLLKITHYKSYFLQIFLLLLYSFYLWHEMNVLFLPNRKGNNKILTPKEENSVPRGEAARDRILLPAGWEFYCYPPDWVRVAFLHLFY